VDVFVLFTYLFIFCECSNREAQEFVEKFEGALGKGKGRRLYAFKVMMTKVICLFNKLISCRLFYHINDVDETGIFKLFHSRNLSSLSVTLRTSKQPVYHGRGR